jgi:hypothetical protein
MLGRGSLPLDAEDGETAAGKETQEVSDKKKEESEGTFTWLRSRVSSPPPRGSENTVIRSMSTVQAVKRRARRKKHMRRELGKSERRQLHEKEMEVFESKENEIFHYVYLATWKKNILYCFESSLVEIVMVLLTIFALYGSDVADVFWTAESDPLLDAALWLVMILFFVENVCLALAKKSYLCSKSFNLEFLAALSMLFDIKSLNLVEIMENILDGGTAARAGRAARAGTKAGRLTKLLRLLRLVRVLSLFMQLIRLNSKTKVNRVTDVDIFGSEHEKEIIAKGKTRNVTSYDGLEGAKGSQPEPENEPEDKIGAMSRSLSQSISIDAIIFIIVLIFASAIVNMESGHAFQPEIIALKQLDQLAQITGPGSTNMTGAAEAYMLSFGNPYLESKFPDLQNCLYLNVQGVVHRNNASVLETLRARGERADYFVSDETRAVFDTRAQFKDIGDKSALSTTVAIAVIFAMIIKFKDTSDRVTKQVNTPLLNLCDDMLLVSDMDLEGPIIHLPSSINEIRHAQLAFLKMKHALSSFGKYVPHEVVREMIKRGKDAELGMERCVCAFLSSPVSFFFSVYN